MPMAWLACICEPCLARHNETPAGESPRRTQGLRSMSSGCRGLRSHTVRQRHRFVGAVLELNGHENHLAIAEILQVVHLELALAVALVASLARLISVFDNRSVMDVLAGTPTGDRCPEIVEHMAMEADAFAGGEADDPHTRPLVLRQ